MLYNNFIKKYEGKKIDFDGQFNCQCVDLFNRYCVDVLELKIGYYPEYAKEFWTERNSVKWLKDNFKFISIDFDNPNIKKGDIGIRTSGYAGHIFIIDDCSQYTFTYYDTNGTGRNDKMTKRVKPFNYNFISGVLRPKNQKNITKNPADNISFTVGREYTLLFNMNVRASAGNNARIKKRTELTQDGKKHAIKNYTSAVLKKSTKITVLEINRKIFGEIWLKIPSGWICGYKGGKLYAKR